MKHPLLILALAAPLLPALGIGEAGAFPTGTNHDIRVEGSLVGKIQARNRVVDTGNACRYTLQWTLGSAPLSRTVRCDVLELKASNNFDCLENAQDWVTTLVLKTGSCSGFDEFGQQTRIDTLTGGESEGGLIVGVFLARSVGDIQNFIID